MKVKNEREVAQSCLTLRDPMDRSLPGSPIHGICQARVLEWVAIAQGFVPASDHRVTNGFSSELKLRGASSGPCLDLFWYLRVMPQGATASADWEPELLRMNAPSMLWRNSFSEKKALVLLKHRKVLILPWVSPTLSSLVGMPAHQVRNPPPDCNLVPSSLLQPA